MYYSVWFLALYVGISMQGSKTQFRILALRLYTWAILINVLYHRHMIVIRIPLKLIQLSISKYFYTHSTLCIQIFLKKTILLFGKVILLRIICAFWQSEWHLFLCTCHKPFLESIFMVQCSFLWQMSNDSLLDYISKKTLYSLFKYSMIQKIMFYPLLENNL